VGNAIHESSLRALAAKLSQCLPDRQRNLLYLLFSHARHRLIAERQPRDGRTVLTENAIELCFQIVAALTHVFVLTAKLIFD